MTKSQPKALTIIYDLETYCNLFLVGYQQVDTKEIKFLQVGCGVDELSEIVKLFQTKKTWFVGYNSHHYDNVMINFIFQNVRQWENLTIDTICAKIHRQSQDIIAGSTKYKWGIPFKNFDLMRVGNIHKSLKMVAINLKWKKIQELPIHFHATIKPEEVDTIRTYCANDVGITMSLFEKLRREINMRKDTSIAYGVNVMDEADSGIANRLLNKLYSKKMDMAIRDFKDTRTSRNVIKMSDVVHPGINFTTRGMQRFIKEFREKELKYGERLKEQVRIGDSVYTIGKGGLHSDNPPRIVEHLDGTIIRDLDAASYYPDIMGKYGIKPKHLSKEFLVLLNEMTTRRLAAKKSKDKVTADALKIVINSIFGKLGFEYYWLFDLLALYRVTVNGQLFLLMLIENLEEVGIEVFYANTDGVTSRVREDQLERYKEICDAWQARTGFTLEFEDFQRCMIRDVNNYIVVKKDGSTKLKGTLDIKLWTDVTKAFNKPVVAVAIYEFFVNNTPVEKTIKEHKDLLDFCMAQKPAKTFDVFFDEIDPDINSIVRTKLQQANRYYVSTVGGSILKAYSTTVGKNAGREISMVAGETVVLLNDFSTSVAYPKPKYAWYIKEATKIIKLFDNLQTDMFAKNQTTL